MLILEKEDEAAQHQTGRNSGVIHSGVYYPPGTLKAELATRGSKKIIEFCKDFGIPYDKCGKIIVATNENELEYLSILKERGIKNGLSVRTLTRDEMLEKEPYVNGIAALHVPETGIVSYKKIADVLVNELQHMGTEIIFGQEVKHVTSDSKKSRVIVPGNSFEAEIVINCGGLHSDKIASKSGVNWSIGLYLSEGNIMNLSLKNGIW